MDKRLIGQWYKEELGETLNIFDAEPPRMKVSFSSSGYYNFDPNCAYEKDGWLCYEINDDHYRMVYHLKIDGENDDVMTGFYTQFSKETLVTYARVSHEPEDGEFRYAPTEIMVPGTDKTRVEILRQYADYDRGHKTEPYSTEYTLGGELPEVLEKYGYRGYIDGIAHDDDRLAFANLDFVCDHWKHDGTSGMPNDRTVAGLIAFCEDHNNSINCRGLAMILATLLRYCGIKARHITCMPYEEPFYDCHVVVDCELPSGKRVMIDPTYRLYAHDKNGEYVSLPRLRQMLIDGEEYFPNDGASYNGIGFDVNEQREYMTKNTLRFSRGTWFVDGAEERSKRCVQLIPKDYPTVKFSDRQIEEFVYDDEEFWKM